MGGLDSLVPTKAEIADAKMLLQSLSVKEKKSKMASFAHFVKDNPVLGLQPGERGTKRTEYVEKFMVFQSRQKAAKKTLTSGREAIHAEKHVVEHHWWAMEKMNDEIGADKAQH